MSVALLARSTPVATRVVLATAGAAAAAVWAMLALASPAPAFQGWLTAFAFWSGPSVGATALLLIARLTGGRWGEAFAPELEPAARAAPLLLLLALPLPFGLPALYPWAADPAAVDTSVRAVFLNPVAYVLVGGGALAGWSVIAGRRAKIGRVGAGLALAFHGLTASLVAPLAITSVSPGLTNSAGGMNLVCAQLAAALGWAALQGVERPARRPAGDLGALLFAVALGLSYLVFMGWLVAWYADRPVLNLWWGPRTGPAWGWLATATVVLGLALPAAAMALRRRFGVRRGLLVSGGGVWTALALYAVWLFTPSYGSASLAPAAVAFVAQGGLWLAAVGGLPRANAPGAEVAHG